MREITDTIRQRQRDFDEIQRQAEGKQDRGRTAQSELENSQAQLMVLKADLADRQRDLHAAKAERQSEEQKAWQTEDELKQVKLDHRKAEQALNEIVRMHD